MAKAYSVREIKEVLLASGFEYVKGNGGSHQKFVEPASGAVTVLPDHAAGISHGVAESILKSCVFAARINNSNIGSNSTGFSPKITQFIVDHQKKCKENPLNFLPERNRIPLNIETEEDMMRYINQRRAELKQGMSR